MPENWLKNKDGEPIMMACAGFTGQPPYNFAVPEVREIWKALCANATKTKWVDGCFSDRAVGEP